MKKIEICNLRFNKMEFEYDIRVDRYNKVLGNRFIMENENDRFIVINKYRDWFYNEVFVNKNEVVLNELRRLYKIYMKYGKLRLFCWCYPKACHSEVIREFLERYI